MFKMIDRRGSSRGGGPHLVQQGMNNEAHSLEMQCSCVLANNGCLCFFHL
jgi:hypothetical protein